MSGIVMLLPHGYEGQGPEHSSARLERFLQLCAEDNVQVVNCTTPANYFHVLRRQLHRSFRKPLIIMTPKSLLRHKRCVSGLEMFGPGSTFHRVLYDDDLPSEPKKAKQLVLCSGKIYYDLLEERETRGIEEVHFLRLEQIYPFPHDALRELMTPYKDCDLVWCQEEPRNMGAWAFASTFIQEVAEEVGFKNPRPRYAGRKSAGSPATGLYSRHVAEQQALIDDALALGKKAMSRIQTRIAEEAEKGKGARSAKG
jgi:2-oxoglutarate dehydrogenase E1 component